MKSFSMPTFPNTHLIILAVNNSLLSSGQICLLACVCMVNRSFLCCKSCMLCNIHRYEQQRENLSNQSFNIEQQNFAIQGLKDTKATVSELIEVWREWFSCNLHLDYSIFNILNGLYQFQSCLPFMVFPILYLLYTLLLQLIPSFSFYMYLPHFVKKKRKKAAEIDTYNAFLVFLPSCFCCCFFCCKHCQLCTF